MYTQNIAVLLWKVQQDQDQSVSQSIRLLKSSDQSLESITKIY